MAKKKANLGCLFWLALVLLVIVIFLFNQKNMENVLRETNFFQILTNRDKPIEVTIDNQPQTDTDPRPQDEITLPDTDEPPDKEPAIEITPENENPEPDQTTEITENEPQKKNVRNASLYYIKIDPNGNIQLNQVTKPVYFNDSPLKETILALINGEQTPSEVNNGLYNMIPAGTKLLNIYIKGDTAYLDFSEDFLFNPLGEDGLQAQVKQVVYTATEFSNVAKIQLLIEGKIREYLSSEGLYIGQPLSRNSLS